MQSGTVKRISILGFTILALLVPFGGYYLSYVASQRDYYRTKNLRVLRAISTQIESRLKGLSRSVQNAADKATSDLRDELAKGLPERDTKAVAAIASPLASGGISAYTQQRPLVEEAVEWKALLNHRGKSAEDRARMGTRLEDSLKRALEPISEQAGTPVEYVNGTLCATWSDRGNTRGPIASAEGPAPRVSMRLDPIERSIYLTYSRRSDPTFSFDVKCKLNRDGSKSGLLAPIIERYVFDEISDGHQHLFEAVVIADQDDGRVIYQQGQIPATLASLKGLISAGEGKDIDTHQRTSTIHDVRLAGSRYKLFMEPLQLPVSKQAPGTDVHTELTVVGLIGEDRFSNQTLAISYNFLLGVGGILLLSCMSWPLLKVLLMGPRDRLKTVDLVGICVSALLSVSLVTLIILDFHAYSALDRAANEELREFGDLIDTHARAEFSAAERELERLKKALPDFKSAKKKEVWILDPESSCRLLSVGDPAAVPYPYFNEANWIDNAGRQRVKWTTREDTRPFIKVSDRTYFLKAREGKFCVDAISSRTSGEKTAAMSIPLDDGLGVLSIGTRLLSLFDTVVPPGFGYAVVDEDGMVLFHSDTQKNKEENLFDECSESRRLRASIQARSARDFDTLYVGRGHHFYVRPLENSEWTIVAFRDKQILRTVNLQVLVHLLLLLLVYGAIQSAVLSAALLPALRGHSAWLWPDQERTDLYRAALVLSAILALLLAIAVALASGWTLVVIAMGFPVFGVILAKFVLEGRVRAVSKWLLVFANWAKLGPRSFRKGYVLVWASMLALAGLLPAFAFFNVSYQIEMTKFTKCAQMRIARSLQERTQRIEDYCKSVFPPGDAGVRATAATAEAGGMKGGQSSGFNGGNLLKISVEGNRGGSHLAEVEPWTRRQLSENARADFLKRRLGEKLDDYSAVFLKTRIPGETDPLPESDGGIEALLSEYVPLFDQTSAETLNLTDSRSADDSWMWRRGPGQSLRLQRKTPEPGSTITLVSEIPGMLHGASGAWWLFMIPFLLIPVGLCHLISRFVSRRVMLLEIVDPAPLLPEPLGSSPISEHTLVLQRAGDGAGIRWNEEAFTIIRPREFDAPYAEARLTNVSTQAVVIDHFDDRAYDPDATMQKLRLIEALFYENKTVIAVSTIDPLRFAIPVNGNVAVAERRMSASAANGSGDADSASVGPQVRAFSSPPSEASCRERWVAIFDKFVGIHLLRHGQAIASGDLSDGGFYDLMRCGKQPWPYLEKIRRQIIQLETAAAGSSQIDHEETKECLLDQVSEMARPFHRDIWENCSKEERIALFDLAGDGLINANNPELKQLIRRGLIIRDPTPRLIDESFRRFVVIQGRNEDLISLVRDCRRSPWQNSRLPLLLVFLAMAAFLLLTQREMYESTITFVSTLSGGALALFKLLDIFGKGKVADAAQS